MSKTRNYGIDLLRILCMIGIVGLHILDIGGILKATDGTKANYCVAWSFEIIFYCATSTFAMITGFLYINRTSGSYHTAAIIKLIVTAFFWCVVILVLTLCFFPTLLSGVKSYVYALFPPAKGGKTGGYWYLTSYTFLFFMIPYINRLLNSLSKRETKVLLTLLLVFFCVAPTIGLRDYFVINEGYSPFWLIFCYMIGAYIKKYGLFYNTKRYLLPVAFGGNVVLLLGSKLLIAEITTGVLGHPFAENILITYVSPFILANSVLLLSLFKDINIKKPALQKGILLFSGCAFSVYIIHCNTLVFENWIAGCFSAVGQLPCLLMVVCIICIPIAIYLACSCVELIRQKLFRLARIDAALEKLGRRLDRILY